MLWIEYDSISPCDAVTVKNVLEKIAEIIAPFPVAAYDTQESGIGLLVHDGFYPEYDDESARSSSLSPPVAPQGLMDLSTEMAGAVADNLTIIEDVMEDARSLFSTLMRDDETPADMDLNDRGNGASNDGSPGTNIRTGGIGYLTESSDGCGNCQFNEGGNDNEDDEDDACPPTPPAESPMESEIYVPSGTFTGRTKLDFGSSSQELSISFDLEIAPSRQRGKVNCAISIDNLLIRASQPDSVTDAPKSMRYITDRVALIIGPSGRCYPPTSVSPQERDFVERQTTSMRTQIGASIEASAQPSLTLQGMKSIGKSVDHRSITLSVQPISIGAGQGDEICWFYRTHCKAETHLELSSKNPPTHEVSYRISPAATMPDNFRIQVQAMYHLRKIPRRLKSSFPARFRFLKDVIARDLKMTLEVTIEEEAADNFLFPKTNKEGCDLELESNIREGFKGQATIGGRGSINAELSTAEKCK
jgi:hypothetical protein